MSWPFPHTLYFCNMQKIKRLFNHRFGPLAVLALIVFILSFITTVVLMIKSWPNLELTPLRFISIFLIGLFYDLVVWSFFAIPVALYCWLMKDSFYRNKWFRIPLFLLFFILTFLLVLNACGEVVFWDEFGVRYNFIAVDYLIYTTEVINNILESYNIPLIAGGVILVVILILILVRKPLTASQNVVMRFGRRTIFFLLFMLVPVAGYFLVNNRLKNISNNNYVNELSGNGIYEFGAAFWNNEIDYKKFYKTENDTASIKILRSVLQAPDAKFINDSLNIDRIITSDSLQHKWN